MTTITGYLKIEEGDVHRLRVRNGRSLYEITLNGTMAGDIRTMPKPPTVNGPSGWKIEDDDAYVDIAISDGRTCRIDLGPLAAWLIREHDTRGTSVEGCDLLGGLRIRMIETVDT